MNFCLRRSYLHALVVSALLVACSPAWAVTHFYQEGAVHNGSRIVSSIEVAEASAQSMLAVQVSIRGDSDSRVRLDLIAPDGTSLRLGEDLAAPVRGTFGHDLATVESLERLEGVRAAGRWRLVVVSKTGSNVTLVRWGLVLQAGDPGAGSIPSGEQRQVIPVVGHVAGAYGTLFRSEVDVVNQSAEPAEVPLSLDLEGRSLRAVIHLAGDAAASIDDALITLFNRSGSGVLSTTAAGIALTSRIATDQGEGSYGQQVRSFRWQEGVSEGEAALQLFPLATGSSERANLGVAEVAGSAGRVEISLFDQEGTLIESIAKEVAPGSLFQIPVSALNAVRASVQVLSGGCRVVPYASVVDNLSNDARFVAPARKQRLDECAHVAAVMRGAGAARSNWHSDLFVLNTASDPRSFAVIFLPTGAAPLQRAVTLAPGALLRLEDVVAHLGGENAAASGHLAVDGARLDSILTSSVISAAGSAGRFGDAIPARTFADSQSHGQRGEVIGLEQSGRFRTNLGMSEVAGGEVEVRVTVYDAAGAVVASVNRTIQAYGHLQESLPQMGVKTLSGGRARFEIVQGGGRIFSYAAVVDNLTNDPTYHEAR